MECTREMSQRKSFLVKIVIALNVNSYWKYENKNGDCGLKVSACCNELPYVSEAKLRKILNPKAPSESIAYKLFIAKAQELFELGNWKGEYRDL